MKRKYHPQTLSIRNQLNRTSYREHSSPIFMTSSFVFETAEQAKNLFADAEEGFIYSRFSNPNAKEFSDKMCMLENVEEGFPTASGMSAVFVSMASFLNAGDHIIACRSVFGSTHQLFTQIFPKWNITCTYVNASEIDTWDKYVQKNTKLCYVETPTNPGLELIDLEKLSAFCKKNQLINVVDNCFATPVIQTPKTFGVDVIVHSATKFIDGQGRSLGGWVGTSKELIPSIIKFARHTGPAISPFNAWTLSKSLETLHVRMEKHSDNAMRIAQYLETVSNIEKVYYPFLPSHPQYQIAKKQMSSGGGIVCFVLKGGYEKGAKFLDSNTFFSFTANLGDTRTIIAHPASTTHSKLTEEERIAVNIQPGMIRISVGLEYVDDIIHELDVMLKKNA